MSEAPKSVEFPTADTVPFPFESPYNVQRELMAAILDTLRQCRNDQQGVSNEENGCIDAALGDVGEPKSRRAPIIMLESPTGTGKSLSLACASMAWLKYCEHNDCDKLSPANDKTIANEQNDHEVKELTSDTAPSLNCDHSNKIKKYDWIDAWQPSDQHSTIERPPTISDHTPSACTSMLSSDFSSHHSIYSQSRTPCHHGNRIKSFAIENRAALESELTKLRARLDRLDCIASSESSSLQHDRKEKERTIRENLVRSGVASALANERKLNRQFARYKGENLGQMKKRRKITTSREVDQFLLETYHSDDEAHRTDNMIDSDEDDEIALNDLCRSNEARNPQGGRSGLSSMALLEGSNLDGSGYQNDPERNARFKKSWEKSDSNNLAVGSVKAGTGLRKIIYAARTHSQLSQFIGELKRTHWGNDVKVVALGSRSLLCSNENVLYSSNSNEMKFRRSEAEITEMCLDMQKNKIAPDSDSAKRTNKKSSCPYMASLEAISTLALHSLVRPSDVEDMARLGKASLSCSYYASRQALAAAEVVVVPYNILLSQQARQSVGLSIKNSLVVIDEAHNVPETLRSISSCQLSLSVAEMALSQLLAYIKKYSGRLAGRNVFYLGQIRRILSAMITHLKHPPSAGIHASDGQADQSFPKKTMMAAVDLMFTLKLDNINLFTILRYLEKSRLSQKLLGFINQTAISTETVKDNSEFWSKHISSMSIFETFIQRLTVTSNEGKVIVEWLTPTTGSNSASFRFTQIHLASQFGDVLQEAHAIVLAGGTLRPFTHVAAELFGDDSEVMIASSKAEALLARDYDMLPTGSCGPVVDPSLIPSSFVQRSPRLTTFTCGHVIPSSNVHLSCLSLGPTNQKLDFRHSSRTSTEVVDELGLTILNLCKVVPKGFVVFLPSYNYESTIFMRWRATGILKEIERKKSIHREPKNSRDLEAALTRYSEEASGNNYGAILFSVMGGKMSEGINFADDRARCVLVAGLPYADITDPILREKMHSLDKEAANAGKGITGQVYYQNLCMRTVNQSVGRAIRHANDHAAIILADFRYATDTRIWRGLPQWLRRGSVAPNRGAEFLDLMSGVKNFFAKKNHSPAL